MQEYARTESSASGREKETFWCLSTLPVTGSVDQRHKYLESVVLPLIGADRLWHIRKDRRGFTIGLARTDRTSEMRTAPQPSDASPEPLGVGLAKYQRGQVRAGISYFCGLFAPCHLDAVR